MEGTVRFQRYLRESKNQGPILGGSIASFLGLFLFFSLLSAFASAEEPSREVRIPLRLDHRFLREALVRQVYTDGDETARVWDDGSGCNFFILREPRIETQGERLRVVTPGRARVGTAIANRCLVALDWSGFVEVFEEPRVEAGAAVVTFRVVDSNIYGADWRKKLATGTLWDWVKKYVHPRLEALRIDLHGPIVELRALLPLFLPAENAEAVRQLVDSLSIADVSVSEIGVTATLRLLAGRVGAVSPSLQPEAPLTAGELARWEAAWRRWDAFLTFLVKHAAGDTAKADLRNALLGVLLAGRHDLLEALSAGAPAERDPARSLFLKTWERLAPVLRDVSTGLPGEAALRYLTFIAAADALEALDKLGPQFGLEISSDGLRRLARIVAPAAVEDPLAYSVAVDPALRALFGFGPPLELPEEGDDAHMSGWLVTSAWAAESVRGVARRLDRWIPSPADLMEYLLLVRELLNLTASKTLASDPLDGEFHELYRWLTLATAWQETCWRQFVRVKGTIRPIKSKVGSVGLMQVNEHVWRGFYDIGGLHQDIGYNAAAGSEILLHYLRDYAIAKGEHLATGSADNLARATYAAYNGGPGQLRRYRRRNTSRRLRKIDDLFWQKYRQVKAGEELGVARCYGGG